MIKKLFTLLFVLVMFQLHGYTQCLNTTAYGTFTAPTSGSVSVNLVYAGEYNTINSVVENTVYRTSSSISTDYITIRKGNYNGDVVAHGLNPLYWIADESVTYYSHINTNSSCGLQSTGRTITLTYISSSNGGCLHKVELYDDYGDGWNGGQLSINVNGTTVLSNITLNNGFGPGIFYFFVNDGDEIKTTYTAGSWSYENEYFIYDYEGNLLGSDGLGGTTPASGGITVTANCGGNIITNLKLHNFGDRQVVFNNIRQNTLTPTFCVSFTGDGDKIEIELNTNSDFSGDSYSQIFEDDFESEEKHYLICDDLGFPSTNNVSYFVRFRVSYEDEWSNWLEDMWVYTYATDDLGWYLNIDEQFIEYSEVINLNFGNHTIINDNKIFVDQANVTLSVSSSSDQALREGNSYYSGAANDCITVGYYNVTGRQDWHGFRFPNAKIPNNAEILSAKFKPIAHSGSGCGGSPNTTNQLHLIIRGVAQDNCNVWANSTNNQTGCPRYRNRTNAEQSWYIPSTNTWSTGLVVESAPDITNIVTEIINRPSYQAGNTIGIIVDHNTSVGTGNYWRYFATMRSNSNYKATIDVEYTNFKQQVKFTEVDLSSFYGTSQWEYLMYDANLDCGDCYIKFYVYNDSDVLRLETGENPTSPIDISSIFDEKIYVVVELFRNDSPELYNITLSAKDHILPVELISFNAECNDTKSVVTWETASEINSDYFILEHSSNMKTFTKIGEISAAGFSSTNILYEFINHNAKDGDNYYRLTQVDFDGTINVYHIIRTYCEKNLNLLIYPNPFNDYFIIKSDNPLNNVKIFNMNGQIIFDEFIDDIKIKISEKIDDTGVYIINVYGQYYKILKK